MNRWLQTIYNHSPIELQNTLITLYRYSRRPIEYGRPFRRYQRLLEDSQWWSREQLDAWQLVLLKRLIRHSYDHVPAYRRLYGAAGIEPGDIRDLADISRLPVISKAQIQADPRSFTASNARAFQPVALNTSGTTGAPFQFLSTRATEALEWAFYWRHKSWGGARLWDPIISMGGKMVVPISQKSPPFWRFNRAEGLMWLSTFHMTPANLDLYIEQVRRSGIRFLKGYPSNLSIFAQHLRRRGVRLPMRAVFTGSEPLFDHIRSLIEDRFACKVFDWYGVSERVVTASQCGQHGDYHIHMENCLVEILAGAAPAAPGQPGELVATNLTNYAMPLIRYRTGDLSAHAEQPCACGRQLATIKQVQTKWEHIITTADGRWISPSVLTHPFKPIKGVARSQIIQQRADLLLIKVVADEQFDAEQRSLLAAGFRERLGAGMEIVIEQVADIPRDPSGKYRWVISMVPSAINRSQDDERIRQQLA